MAERNGDLDFPDELVLPFIINAVTDKRMLGKRHVRFVGVPEIVKRRSAKLRERSPRIPQPLLHPVRIPRTRKNVPQIDRARAAKARLARTFLQPVVVALRCGPFQRLQYTVPSPHENRKRERTWSPFPGIVRGYVFIFSRHESKSRRSITDVLGCGWREDGPP
jgi:hypothetical protein